jgi:hypothetical protein
MNGFATCRAVTKQKSIKRTILEQYSVMITEWLFRFFKYQYNFISRQATQIRTFSNYLMHTFRLYAFISEKHNKITGSDVITEHALNARKTLWRLAAKYDNISKQIFMF